MYPRAALGNPTIEECYDRHAAIFLPTNHAVCDLLIIMAIEVKNAPTKYGCLIVSVKSYRRNIGPALAAGFMADMDPELFPNCSVLHGHACISILLNVCSDGTHSSIEPINGWTERPDGSTYCHAVDFQSGFPLLGTEVRKKLVELAAAGRFARPSSRMEHGGLTGAFQRSLDQWRSSRLVALSATREDSEEELDLDTLELNL